MHSRSCRGTSVREPTPFNAILNVFIELPYQKKRIEITASFHITLKTKIITLRHADTHITLTPAASLEHMRMIIIIITPS
jgi:hypothetical protein